MCYEPLHYASRLLTRQPFHCKFAVRSRQLSDKTIRVTGLRWIHGYDNLVPDFERISVHTRRHQGGGGTHFAGPLDSFSVAVFSIPNDEDVGVSPLKLRDDTPKFNLPLSVVARLTVVP